MGRRSELGRSLMAGLLRLSAREDRRGEAVGGQARLDPTRRRAPTHRLVVGERGLKEGKIEYKGRSDAEAQMIVAEEIVVFVREQLA